MGQPRNKDRTKKARTIAIPSAPKQNLPYKGNTGVITFHFWVVPKQVAVREA